MRPRWFGCGLLLGTLACQSNVRFLEAPPVDGMASVVFVRFLQEGSPGAILTDTDPLLIEQAVDEEDRLVLAAYARTSDRFAWSPGILPVSSAADSAAFLPAPDAQWVVEPGESTWRTLDDDVLADVPLSLPTVERCLLSGGCYRTLGESERGECSVCEPVPPEPTAMPEPVQWDAWSRCPDGATLVADPDLDLEVCEVPDLVGCGPYERQPMLSAECESVAACPAGLFADRRTGETSRLFVDPAAAAGGDGSENSPFSLLADAAASATSNTVIYLAAGTYDVPQFATRLTLRGACPERVTLTGLVVRNATLAVNRIAVSGPVDVGADAHLDVGETWIDGPVIVDAATAYFNGSVLLGSAELRGDASVRFEQSSLRGVLQSEPDAVVVGTDLSVVAPINTAGSVDIRRSRVDRAGFSTMAGGPVVLEDVWWQDSETCSGASLRVQQATASLTRVAMNRPGAGPMVFDRANATLDEVLFRDSINCPRALTSSSSQMNVRRFASARTARETVYVNGTSNVSMQDVLLSKSNKNAAADEAIRVHEPSMLTIERARITDQRHVVVLVTGGAAMVELHDVDISDLRSIPRFGARVLEAKRATVIGHRVRVTNATEVLVASDGSTLRFEDFSTDRTVNPIRSRDRSDVEVTRAQFDETLGVGACAQFGASANLFDVVVTGVRTSGGEERPNCPNGVVAGGVVFAASVDAALFVTRFTVTDAPAAFMSFKPRAISAQDGLVRQTPIAVLGGDETDLSEFLIKMRYEGVEQPILLR